MIRIDENTYIDDTLVTCAEYQLFINEMLEQGKYYQPDHWTSYQFPGKQARKPILGVRHSDAVAFCEWLTRRETGKWKYSLPLKDKAEIFPIKMSAKEHLGYWLNEDYQFKWIVNSNKFTHIHDLNHTFSIVQDLALALKQDLTRVLKLDRTQIYLLQQFLGYVGTSDYARIRANLEERALNLAGEITNKDAPTNSIDQIRARTNALTLTLECVFSLLEDLDQVTDRPPFHNLDYKVATTRDLIYNQAIDIEMDLTILQQRIAGRSPAFEGIRLVKERKQ
jgi:hypothetical protein